MNKIRVMVVAHEIDDQIDIKSLLPEDSFTICGFIDSDEMAPLKILSQSPDITVIAGGEQGYKLAEELYSQSVGMGLVTVEREVTPELLSRAMSCGINRVISYAGTPDEVRDTMLRIHELEYRKASDNNIVKAAGAKVVAFFGGKGGTGKTTVAVNTACALALTGKKTAILDLDLQFGDVSVTLDIEPKDTICDLAADKSEITVDRIRGIMTLHKSGLSVLSAPKSPEFAEYVTENTVQTVINLLRPYFEYVIIDLAPGFSDTTVAALENSDVIELVATTDIASLRNAKICVDILEALQQQNKVDVILNRSVEGLIVKRDFEDVLNTEVKHIFPDDTKTALTALNRGVPFVTDRAKTPLGKAVTAFAAGL